MQKNNQSKLEFIALMASLMSLVALSIDALLPALEQIGISIRVQQGSHDSQLLVTMIFLGLGFGQLISGPISDSLGRKPVIYGGFILFVIASFICVSATNIEMMVLGRVLQGIGLSAPRTISIAMVRDSFSGNYMAKIMSFIVVIFILVPVVAPAIGKLMLDAYGWKSIFYSQLIFGVLVMFWLWKRQPETLQKENRIKFAFRLFLDGSKEFIKYKQAVIFTLISGFITGSFMVYLSASQQIFQEQYLLVDEFPYIFAGLAISVGFATFLNGSFVMKFGMHKLVSFFLIMFSIVPIIYITLFYQKENPSIVVLLIFFALQFFSIGFLFGNLRALAMQPVGHIAGIGAAINGFVSTIMAVPIATFIGKYVETTTLPLFIGFFICGALSLLLLNFTKLKPVNE
ncbi:MFS transporter, DHA1 family, bicyclomycin/chloramphenicol resistance protein [Tenacibaculum mesophilum]|uniref:Bcr/CflA family efflux MFS transporter n=1 Tax=Tenacibaculum mesophilum TaxID=104268 RepID=A0AAE9MK83_9FLAO|nr:multidrug effflux MFS transporter [Tenacibaculum mesophilum]GFD93008.1 Bcr/CflA family drug resistance efflux transporter [Alteromonas sp. KUL154]GFE01917.1 Bcr/CflA family drug resistance efflux transporter [Alteromonas sp. KUL156]AZJ31689.1 Bcr/CflA family efflux MFS transporter [Tenacibaculum mesophilum]QFS26943.1 Bcr/CflA family efflux MFS transporter [Tenacibaculum mesophilum]UTD14366.1 multidrug effflux MFS transporter [Tenacibaculum mesophilum]